MFKKLRRYLKSKKLASDIKKGKVARGRTIPDGNIKTISKGRVAISARVIRKSGKVEDLGVIYKGGGEKRGKS